MSTAKIQPTAPTSQPLILQAPLAKSSAIRALLAAALAGGGTIRGAGPRWPRDVEVMAEGLRKLGAKIERSSSGICIQRGIALSQPPDRQLAIEVLDAGTPARFLVAASALTGASVTINGTERLAERPLEALLGGLEAMGAQVQAARSPDGSERCFPVTIRGPLQRRADLRVDGGETSQFLSALLLIAPAAGQPDPADARPISVRSDGPMVSTPYIALTHKIMREFGIGVSAEGEIPAEAQYRPAVIEAEADWSGASILLSACAFAQRPVMVPQLSLQSAHPDRAVVPILERLGLTIAEVSGGIEAKGEVLRGGVFDMRSCPDAVPAVVALAALSPEPVEVVGVEHLRLKESDRLSALRDLLLKVGAEVSVSNKGLKVVKSWVTQIRANLRCASQSMGIIAWRWWPLCWECGGRCSLRKLSATISPSRDSLISGLAANSGNPEL